jgi:hypothetical protein
MIIIIRVIITIIMYDTVDNTFVSMQIIVEIFIRIMPIIFRIFTIMPTNVEIILVNILLTL